MELFVYAAFLCAFGTSIVYGDPQPGCDERYFQHYVLKGCQPVFGDDGSKCPIRYNCPQTIPNDTEEGCLFKGQSIPPGEDIPSSSPCRMCSCRSGRDGDAPAIDCLGIECPSVFGPPPDPDCYEVYKKDQCCSTQTVCGENSQTATCDHDGKTYFDGQHIYPKEDPCTICTCSDSWTGDFKSDPSCYRLDCIMEEKLQYLKKGCLPIYHEGTCCPIEYDCGENFPNTTVPLATNEDIASGNTCSFKGSHYRIGQILDIAHPTNCVTCQCTTPPEFTCVHQSCVYPSDVRCVYEYKPGSCCPTYDCPSA